MDAKKKSSQTEAQVAPATDNAPVKLIFIDDVSASVFAREYPVRGKPQTFYSVSFSRSYRDAQGARKYVKTFNPEDLGKIVSCAQQASDFIRQSLETKDEK
ncbi:MAG: hypothetical protein JSS02_23280 [Planctomycetes bacterium]|nr:hypothetical protein [Planctomycetota bacterium]